MLKNDSSRVDVQTEKASTFVGFLFLLANHERYHYVLQLICSGVPCGRQAISQAHHLIFNE